MDLEQNNNLSGPIGSEPSEPIPGEEQGGPTVKAPSKAIGWKVFFGIILALSIIANIALVLMLIWVVAIFAAGQRGVFAEEVIRKGPARTKIAVISVEGIIHGERAKDVGRQLKAARRDNRVKGLIVRVNSPGGTISGSDQIYKEILKYRQEEKKPVIAFMQGMAASGGYYTSVACEKIIAEPTTITGSIGVITLYFVLQELLEDKLGILPVVVKSGLKKDWPSSFQAPTEEQLQYLQDKLIDPAYKRFVQIVAEGRKSSLTVDQIRELADGGIFGAQEALEEKLIDEIGYLDEAIELVKSLAGIEKAQVVEYRKPFSLASFLSYRNRDALKINTDTLYELSTPRILYLWTAY
ncbi:MAG: signal peptide peptidase SppA [Phycisphaerae bacterium]